MGDYAVELLSAEWENLEGQLHSVEERKLDLEAKRDAVIHAIRKLNADAGPVWRRMGGAYWECAYRSHPHRGESPPEKYCPQCVAQGGG